MSPPEAKPDGTILELEGDGPFELPICSDVNMALGEVLAVLRLTTIEGKDVLAPMGHQQVIDLHGLTRQVLEQIGLRGGGTVQ